MNEQDWLAEQFEEHRRHLRAVAYRMLGSLTEADDALQEAWIRLSRSDTNKAENMGGWYFVRGPLYQLCRGTGKRIDVIARAAQERASDRGAVARRLRWEATQLRPSR